MKIKLISSILLISFAQITLFSQYPVNEIDKLLSKTYNADEPGATVLVAKNGEVIFKKAYGIANMELDVSMRPEMIFEIGSITKQFTAIAILMLEEQGKLSIKDDLKNHIEDYPTHGHNITIHHLLTHTSGIKSYTSMNDFGEYYRLDYKPVEFLDVFKNEPMDFAPGERYLYNNSAYFLLGVIIEKAAGMSYADFISENIFKPLKMNNSYYGSMRKIIKNRAYGYQMENDEFVNAEFLSLTLPYAAGSLMSNVEDLLKWNEAVHSYKLVSKETLEKAFTNYKLNNGEEINYGYGWGLNTVGKYSTYEHSGGIFGYLTNVLYIPEEKIFVAVLSNKQPGSPADVSVRIAGLVAGVEIPDMDDVINMKSKDLEEYIGVYEFEDSSTRIITLEDDQLYSMRTGGSKYKIYPYKKDKFLFEENLTLLNFKRSVNGEIESVISTNRRQSSTAVKTNKPIPEKEEVNVSEDILKRYTGIFELQPGFNITFTLEDGKLMSQATGQNKFQIFPSSETVFFPKIVDATIEFFVEEDGSVKKAKLTQGGQEFELKRIE
jgi:CubicO group peptidase (beta-lactamase class C family)